MKDKTMLVKICSQKPAIGHEKFLKKKKKTNNNASTPPSLSATF